MEEEHVIQADIDLSALKNNVQKLKAHVGPGVKLAAVVKADAYGHGAVRIARTALENGADFLTVARLSEAVDLRKAGIKAPILMFGHTPPSQAAVMAEHDLTPAVNSLEEAQRLSEAAASLQKRITVHVKIDSGMGRVGLQGDSVDDIVSDVLRIHELPGLTLEGIYTHFANADSFDKTHAREQFAFFRKVLDRLEERGLRIPIRHAANSAATLEMAETHLDMVRPGIILYGLAPSPEVDMSIVPLKPVMSLKARIIHLKEVPGNFKISYGSTYVTERPTKIATVSVGYADGYSRLLSSKGVMLVRGEKTPVVGRVCMDLTMIDVGHIGDAEVGDEVLLFGEQGDTALSVDDLAELTGTINYEIVSTITSRVPRIYKPV